MHPTTGRTVSLEIEFPASSFPSRSGILRLDNVSYPLDENEITRLAEDAGYKDPAAFIQLRERHHVKVTSDKSHWEVGQDGFISMDQPLLHYYHHTFLPASNNRKRTGNSKTDQSSSKAELFQNDEYIDLGGMSIGLRRTIRVPENSKAHLLPPNMGGFKFYNVADYADRLPRSIVSKGGLFIAMHQCEAMWIRFISKDPNTQHAVKVSAGDVNALTGLPRNQAGPEDKQDYAVVKFSEGQSWLDGVSVAPGVVRQFITTPVPEKGTVEGQVASSGGVDGLQLDVYQSYPQTVEFRLDPDREPQSQLLYMTPRQLGLKSGSVIYMQDLLESTSSTIARAPCTQGTQIRLRARSKAPSSLQVNVQTLTGKILNINCNEYTTIIELKEIVQDMEGLPTDQQHFVFFGKPLCNESTLSDYNIQHENTLHCVLHSWSGGGINAEDKHPSMTGFAAGGPLTQKIVRDNLPPLAYNFSEGKRLHVTVINAALFPSLTGSPAPPTPITTQATLKRKLPWFKTENVSAASNATIGAASTAAKSIATVFRKRSLKGKDANQRGCGSCTYELTTFCLVPCGHFLCEDCASRLSAPLCPSCPAQVTSRESVSAAQRRLSEDGSELDDGISIDDRIVALNMVAGTKEVVSFKLREHDVSGLCGVIQSWQREIVV